MHELPITENLLQLALLHARKEKVKRITDLYLVLGQLSSVLDESVQFYWDLISDGTLAKGARLHFRREPARFECRQCQQTFSLDNELFQCPACGSHQVEVVGGDEFYLEAMDVET